MRPAAIAGPDMTAPATTAAEPSTRLLRATIMIYSLSLTSGLLWIGVCLRCGNGWCGDHRFVRPVERHHVRSGSFIDDQLKYIRPRIMADGIEIESGPVDFLEVDRCSQNAFV